MVYYSAPWAASRILSYATLDPSWIRFQTSDSDISDPLAGE